MSEPRIGIPSVEIMLAPSGPVYLSDAPGQFIIAGLPAGPTTVIASKAGFLADTLMITVPVGASLPVEIQLDALPVITQGKIITEKLDEYFPGPTYRAKISADIGDPDGSTDLDSVWSVIEDLWVPMTYSPASRLFEATVFDSDLPTNNLQWLVGKELRIVARDVPGALAEAPGLFLTRIIEESAHPVSPAPGDTTGPSPLLQWSPAAVTFFHSLTLEIVRQDAGTQTVIWTQALVDASLQEFQYSGSLTPRLRDADVGVDRPRRVAHTETGSGVDGLVADDASPTGLAVFTFWPEAVHDSLWLEAMMRRHKQSKNRSGSLNLQGQKQMTMVPGLGVDLPELQKARALWIANRFEESLQLFEQAVRTHPQNLVALVDASRALGARFEIQRGEEMLDRLMKLGARQPNILHLTGQSYRMIFRPDKAIDCFQRVLKMTKEIPDASLELAVLYERRHRIEEAAAVIEDCLRVEPGYVEAQFFRARLLRRMKNDSAAEALFHEWAASEQAHRRTHDADHRRDCQKMP